MYAKKAGFLANVGTYRLNTKQNGNKSNYIYFGPPYSLQKASYSPQFFFYVNLKYIALMYAKKAGFSSYCWHM